MRRWTQKSRNVMALLLMAVLLLSTVGITYAGSEGRKNTAIVLTGAAVVSLAKGNTDTALVLGAGAAYAWKKYDDKRDEEKARASFSGLGQRVKRTSVSHSGGRKRR